jgi:dUTP pyrophosphatase
MTKSFKERVEQTYAEAAAIFFRKSAAYGTENVAETGARGIVARLLDKIRRAENVLENPDISADEALLDTALDIANYGVILAMLAEDRWPRSTTRASTSLLVQTAGHENLLSPQHIGDVGYDLRAAEDVVLSQEHITWIPTGVHVKCPPGTWCRVTGRSSMARKRGALVLEGVIDTDYTGELQVGVMMLELRSEEERLVLAGERVGQLVFFRSVTPPVEVVQELPSTERGQAGFGSTGKK